MACWFGHDWRGWSEAFPKGGTILQQRSCVNCNKIEVREIFTRVGSDERSVFERIFGK
jgi:hypothetical protein